MPAAVAGLAYQASKIPSGAAGSSSLLIRGTNEQPAASDGTGSFRTECAYSHMNNDDPLVFPGQVGAASPR